MVSLKKIDINKLQDKLLTTKNIILGSVVIVVLLFGSMLYQSFAPKQANILYSICSSFIELHVTFPQNIRQTYIELYRKSVRIYYTQTDSFGQERMETIECSFFQDPQKGIQVESILFDSVKDITTSTLKRGTGRFYEVRPEVIEQFNISQSPTAILDSGFNIAVPEGAQVRRF